MARGGIVTALLLGKDPNLAVPGGDKMAMKMNCISLSQTDLWGVDNNTPHQVDNNAPNQEERPAPVSHNTGQGKEGD